MPEDVTLKITVGYDEKLRWCALCSNVSVVGHESEEEALDALFRFMSVKQPLKAFHVYSTGAEWSMFVAAANEGKARHIAALNYYPENTPWEAYRDMLVRRAKNCDDLAVYSETAELDYKTCADRMGWVLDEDGFPVQDDEWRW